MVVPTATSLCRLRDYGSQATPLITATLLRLWACRYCTYTVDIDDTSRQRRINERSDVWRQWTSAAPQPVDPTRSSNYYFFDVSVARSAVSQHVRRTVVANPEVGQWMQSTSRGFSLDYRNGKAALRWSWNWHRFNPDAFGHTPTPVCLWIAAASASQMSLIFCQSFNYVSPQIVLAVALNILQFSVM